MLVPQATQARFLPISTTCRMDGSQPQQAGLHAAVAAAAAVRDWPVVLAAAEAVLAAAAGRDEQEDGPLSAAAAGAAIPCTVLLAKAEACAALGDATKALEVGSVCVQSEGGALQASCCQFSKPSNHPTALSTPTTTNNNNTSRHWTRSSSSTRRTPKPSGAARSCWSAWAAAKPPSSICTNCSRSHPPRGCTPGCWRPCSGPRQRAGGRALGSRRARRRFRTAAAMMMAAGGLVVQTATSACGGVPLALVLVQAAVRQGQRAGSRANRRMATTR